MPWKPVDPQKIERDRWRRRAVEAARPKDHNKVYKSTTWKQVRRQKLQAQPVCELCGISPATEVHHLNNNPLDNRGANLCSTCKSCHSAQSLRNRMTRAGTCA
jgi:hypothetical protein